MNEHQKWHRHVVRMMDGVSFAVEFQSGTDAARITGADGWVEAEVARTEGTYDQIRAESHRLVGVAVATGRCSRYANRAAGGELKRNITNAATFARSLPPGAR